jgi:hypothetical protein
MDAPQTAGDWFFSSGADSSTASFGPPESEAIFGLSCNFGSRAITLIQEGEASGPVPVTIRTETTDRTLTAQPTGTELPAIAVTLNPRDPILDAMALSKGRFAVQTLGLPALYTPAGPEITRVIEDCR